MHALAIGEVLESCREVNERSFSLNVIDRSPKKSDLQFATVSHTNKHKTFCPCFISLTHPHYVRNYYETCRLLLNTLVDLSNIFQTLCRQSFGFSLFVQIFDLSSCFQLCQVKIFYVMYYTTIKYHIVSIFQSFYIISIPILFQIKFDFLLRNSKQKFRK